MDINLTPAERTFREEFVSWLTEHLPESWKWSEVKRLPPSEAWAIRRAFEQRMGEARWLGVAWPLEYGGRGATLMEQVIYQEELARLDAPPLPDMVGLQMVGPTLIEIGTPEQKEQYLAPIIRGEDVWYQGFSEPNAGSDLAGLQLRATRDGDEWVLNGQKIWGGGAEFADWGAILARSDAEAPKHRGISFFIVDMKSPGITVNYIRQINGGREFNEVFFDNVRVPADHILGGENQGWRVANRLLTYERGVITMSMLVGFQQLFDELVEYARATRRNGDRLIDVPHLREALARSYTDIQLMRLANLRWMTRYIRGVPPAEETSFMKLFWADTEQGLADVAALLAGPEALPMLGAPHALHGGEWVSEWLYSRVASVYGGTQDIQRNIIAERIFGLPRGT